MFKSPSVIPVPSKRAKLRLARKMQLHPTAAEAKLWTLLKPLGFWTQVLFHGFILDFYHQPSRLIVEVDGSSHKDRKAYDQMRDAICQKYVVKVLRFSNAQVLKTPNLVLGTIKKALK